MDMNFTVGDTSPSIEPVLRLETESKYWGLRPGNMADDKPIIGPIL